jgi:GDP-L-fucose synthase
MGLCVTGPIQRNFYGLSGWAAVGAPELNIGIGQGITIAEFARVVANTVGYTGAISFDPSRPDGTPRKLLDVSRLAQLGWRAHTSLEDGIRLSYQAYLSESKQAAE